MSRDVVTWISGQLSKLLGTEADDDVARYLLSIDNAHELEEYMTEILDLSLSQNKVFVQELLQRWHEMKGLESVSVTTFATEKPKKSRGKSKKSKGDSHGTNTSQSNNTSQQKQLSLNQQPGSVKSSVENVSQSMEGSRSNKTKFVPLFSPEGHDRTVALLPGRHVCECQAAKHALVNNCQTCGRIVCEQEGAGPCFFCQSLVCSKSDQEIIDHNSKKSERLRQHLMKQTMPEGKTSALHATNGLAKALDYKDRLLEYDKTSAKRTHVIDDESDYFATNSNQWLKANERAALQHKETELRNQRFASRRDRKVMLDFAGRRVVEEHTTVDQYSSMQADTFDEDVKSAEFDPDDFTYDLVNPNVMAQPPTYLQLGVTRTKNGQRNNPSTAPHSLRNVRLQDSELQVMSDEGMALSMHQPWASLLVAGIKRHEGRTWYTSHRGVLWIASTAQKPEQHEIAAIEQFYRNFYNNDPNLVFPSSYPSGCLLGCVTVSDCLSHEDYIERYPGGDSDSPYVFICDNPQELTIKFPLRGKHKIYKLEKHVHQAAKKGLGLCRQAISYS